MSKSVSAAQARNNFAEMIGQAHFADETFVIERLGKPYAVVLGYNHYQKLLKAAERNRNREQLDGTEHPDQARLL